MTDLPELEAKLVGLVDEAGRLAQGLRGMLESRIKGDGSIVTAADAAIEQMLRKTLPLLVPGTTVWGEEEGYESEGPGGLWLVDPVDGTSNFSFGSPLWGVSVALARDGELVVGAVSLPDLRETYSATVGAGTAQMNGKPIPPIPPGPIQPHELLGISDGLLFRYPQARWPGKMRHPGAFVIDGCWVAAQRLRGLVNDKCKLYDIAASVLVCQELGADIRYADGSPFVIADLMVDRVLGNPFVIFPRDSGFYLDPAH